ncbi:MAG: SAM-dependent methyltransferase [Oscillospiraceae bacterium]|nr:SAM-dependent methyltransferase [Oscillospiraceae bacterium]
MELSPRLQAIARQVPQGARLADVGTDHGYLPVWLLLNGRIGYAIAADLRKGPLDRAKGTAQRFGQTDGISFRLCDGLTGIHEEEVDAVAIAGMGGETIAAILEAASWTKKGKLLLLQPMTGAPKLRRWLQGNGYAILQEEIVHEGDKLYSIWNVKGGAMPPLSPAEQWAGANRPGPLRLAYLAMVEGKVRKVLEGHRAAQAPDEVAVAHLSEVLTGLSEMRKELET